ncbi:MAG: hypothetical protein K2G77_00035 [Muribaculaceae bacterium]|nr:hypothetical protein [Muribaculaceae bacterium]
MILHPIPTTTKKAPILQTPLANTAHSVDTEPPALILRYRRHLTHCLCGLCVMP